ncbi:MAG TPA: hypothetical protein EYP58_01795 [bacterium (Candidatus Stahlbacteria)]|nr:hypothetical protein [Candidatus Stahlbacteria bacterium]
MRLFIMFLLTIPLLADFNRTSGLIDIPVADILPHMGYRLGFDGSIALDSEHSADDFDENIHAALGFGDAFEGYIDIYTFSNFTAAFGFCHKFYDREDLKLAWGIHQLSYALDVSEVGHGDSVGWDDDLDYSTKPDYAKPFELGSGYLVTTYEPVEYLDLTIGFGRGRYVGYGPNSRWFNSNFYRDQGGDWAVGLILGFAFKPVRNFALLFDLDGRDTNVGIRFRYLPIELGLALVKAEQFGMEFSPRISASISYLQTEREPEYGIIAGTVTDTEGKPLGAEVGFLHAEIAKKITRPEIGTFRFIDLKPNIYEIYARAEGYIGKKKKVNILAGKTIYVDFELRKKEVKPTVGDIFGKVFDLKTKEPVVAQLTVVEIRRSKSSDATGLFMFKGLAADVYKIKAEAEGYETGFYPVIVNAGEKTEVEIGMVKRGMVLTIRGIKFDFNKATIKPESYPILDNAAAILTNHPEIRVEIQGHTCSLGSDGYNLKLSNDRAISVRNYLIANHRIDPSRLLARGYGERRPVADNRTEAGRIQNRRVDFLILK